MFMLSHDTQKHAMHDAFYRHIVLKVWPLTDHAPLDEVKETPWDLSHQHPRATEVMCLTSSHCASKSALVTYVYACVYMCGSVIYVYVCHTYTHIYVCEQSHVSVLGVRGVFVRVPSVCMCVGQSCGTML